MVFSSAVFLFAYFPVVFLGFYAIPKKYSLPFLFLVNIVFYGWGEPVYVCLMLFSIAFNYGAALLIANVRYKKPALALTIAINLFIIGFFKYSGFIYSSLSGVLPGFAFSQPPLPIGISFYTFQALAYIIDVYRGCAAPENAARGPGPERTAPDPNPARSVKTVAAERNFLKFGVYFSLFPQMNAGPIVRYADIRDQLGGRSVRLFDLDAGLKRFICGLSKKLLLANPVGLIWEAFGGSPGQNGVAGAWIGLVAYAFHIYFDFSGYSDMAIGLGRMLGYTFPENFDYPYMSRSVTEFWRRWHMTLSGWFRDYLYIPLGGSRSGTARNLLNLGVVWLLTGFWHGASWNFALWGLYFALLLIVERTFVLKMFDRIKAPAALRRVYAFGLVTVGWGLFALTDLPDAFSYISELFGRSPAGVNLFTAESLRYAVAFIPTLLICALAATPLPKRVWASISRAGTRMRDAEVAGIGASESRAGTRMRASEVAGIGARVRVIELAGIGALLILCVAAVAAGGYNPFIYYRF